MIVSGPHSQADGPQEISLGPETHLPWREISVSIVDEHGQQAIPTGTAKLQGACTGIGADEPEIFSAELNLVTGERRWKPFMSSIKSITTTPVDLPVGMFYKVTIVSTRG